MTVYPRVCGGTSSGPSLNAMSTGLSPRVRGNHLNQVSVRKDTGSIPACAGEPALSSPVRPVRGVYPRVCGGTQGVPDDATSVWGLSPRVRGNRGRLCVAHGVYGSIPACAGEPTRCCRTGQPIGVYPRVCGGTIWRLKSDGWYQGLSPRVRGNPHEAHAAKRKDGSIPACAGEPILHFRSHLWRDNQGEKRATIRMRIDVATEPRVA